MASTINTNIASLNAQRNLTTSQSSLATSLQRLSSGLRINSAKDDAAGLAISDRMTSQIRGLNQASRNANDGISLTQVAEGAMSESSNILQRMRELSIQSANSTNTTDDRKSLQAEVKSLQSELTRIAQTTEFNGQRVLDGSFSSGSFQVGANANQTIDFAIGSVKGSSIGALAKSTGSEVSSAVASDITISVGGGAATTIASSANFAGTAVGQESDSAFAKAAALNDAGIAGFTAKATTSGTATVGTVGGTAGDKYNLSINGTAIFTNTDVATTTLSAVNIRDAINANSDKTGILASVNGSVMTLSAADGRNIDVVESGAGMTAGDGLSAAAGDFTNKLRGKLDVTASSNITVGGTQADVGLSASIAKDTKGVDTVDISTAAGAQEAIMRIDSAMGTINTSRAAMGALQNRFQSTITSLATTSENLSAARGRILDTDFAAETANLTRGQILQQAGTAMLAQANSLPNGVMALLRG